MRRSGTGTFRYTDILHQMLDVLGGVLDVLTFAVASIGGISLLVGAIGVAAVFIETAFGSGSGFFLNADCDVVTNRHVVEHSQCDLAQVREEIRKAEIALEELGIDPATDRFQVKLTGGTNGDVAGNALRLLFQRSPGAEVPLIVAGSGAACDPHGLDRDELGRLVLRQDITAFDRGAQRLAEITTYHYTVER